MLRFAKKKQKQKTKTKQQQQNTTKKQESLFLKICKISPDKSHCEPCYLISCLVEIFIFLYHLIFPSQGKVKNTLFMFMFIKGRVIVLEVI